MSKAKPNVDSVITNCKSHNGVVYTGFFRSTAAVLNSETAKKINDNIKTLKAIAKNFTVEYLSNKRDASTWTSYLKDLKDNGYEDVYNYYVASMDHCQTEHVDGITSQSDINKKQFNIVD